MHLAPRMLLACILTAVLTPRSAHAQDDFKRYLNAAVQLYKSGENERAWEQLQRAKQRARDVDQDVAVALYEGLIFADSGKKEQALVAFETALLLNPEAKLPERVSPKLNEEFEAVRSRVRKKLSQNTPAAPGTAPVPPSTPGAKPKASKDSTAPTATAAGPSGQAPASPNLKPSVPPAPEPYLPPPTVEKSRSRVPVAPLVLGGVGVVAAGVGTVFGLQSRSNTSKVKEAYEGGRLPAQPELTAVDARLDDARGQARMANVMFGTAALAVGSAVVTWLLSSDDSAAESKGGR